MILLRLFYCDQFKYNYLLHNVHRFILVGHADTVYGISYDYFCPSVRR